MRAGSDRYLGREITMHDAVCVQVVIDTLDVRSRCIHDAVCVQVVIDTLDVRSRCMMPCACR